MATQPAEKPQADLKQNMDNGEGEEKEYGEAADESVENVG